MSSDSGGSMKLFINVCLTLLFLFSFSVCGLLSQDFEMEEEILPLENVNPLLANVKARKLFMNDKLPEAEALLKASLVSNPENGDSQFLLAAVYTKQKKYAQAKDLFYSLLKNNPSRNTYRKLFRIILTRWGNAEYNAKYADLLKEEETASNVEIAQEFNEGPESEYESEESFEMTEEAEEYVPASTLINSFGMKIELSSEDPKKDE